MAVPLAAVLLVAHRLDLEAAVHRLHLEAAVFLLHPEAAVLPPPLGAVALGVAIALEALIPSPITVLPTDIRLVDIRLGTRLVIVVAPLLALKLVSGLF